MFAIPGLRDGDELGDALRPAFEAIVAEGLTFDALTPPLQLEPLWGLLARHSEVRVVIDHGPKPYIRDGVPSGWVEDMAAPAADTNVYCKLSGLVSCRWTNSSCWKLPTDNSESVLLHTCLF